MFTRAHMIFFAHTARESGDGAIATIRDDNHAMNEPDPAPRPMPAPRYRALRDSKQDDGAESSACAKINAAASAPVPGR